MAVETGHIQLTEYRKTTIPYLNWMFEDIFCRYEVSIPYYLLDFSFPEYPLNAEWPAPYTPEWLELYKPKLPPIPGMLWPQLPEPEWPEMNWPALPKVLWPRLPDMPGIELPPWPEMDLQEWERFELEWPEWDWPNWNLPEAERTRWRRRKPTKKEWPVPWQPFKPEWQRTWPYKTEWRGTTWYIPAKPEWRRTWPYGTEWRGITWGDEADNLLRLNTLLEIISDEAGVAVEQLPDLSPQSIALLNNEITALYEAVEEVSADYTYNSAVSYYYAWEKEPTWNATWAGAWSALESFTPQQAGTEYVSFFWKYYKGFATPYRVYKSRGYLSFDTSNLTGKTITAAKITFSVGGEISFIEDYADTLEIYNEDSGDTIDENDWAISGSLSGSIARADIILSSDNDVDIEISHINQTGDTRFKIVSKADKSGYEPPDPIIYSNGGITTIGGLNFSYHTPILTVTATG